MTRIQLKSNHSEKGRAEVFLNALNEKLEQVPFDWRAWKESERIVDAVKLASISKSLIITVIFVDDYHDADIIAKANVIKHPTRWGQNGSIMYLVDSPDQDTVDEVLSTFAGRE